MARAGRRRNESNQSARRFPTVLSFRSNRRRGSRHPKIFPGAVLLVVCMLLYEPPVRAETFACFRTMEEYALGSGMYLPERFIPGTDADFRRSLGVDLASMRLYGIPGLKADAAGLRMEGATFGCASHAIVLSSPVGSEMSFSVEASALFRDWLQSAIAFQYHASHLDRFETAYRVSAALKMCARVSDYVTAGYTIDNLVFAGEKQRGVSASAFMYGHPVSEAGIYAFCALDGAGSRSMGAGVIIQVRTAVRLVMGYDDGSHALRGALTIRAGRFRLSVGSGIHPVLGVTQGVSLGGDL